MGVWDRRINVEDEGILIGAVPTINFIGMDVVAEKSGNRANIYIPAPSGVSHFNTTDGTNDCTVADPSTTLRKISEPDQEGIPFSTGSWGGDGQNHLAIRDANLSFSSNNQCSIYDTNTTFETVVYHDGTSTSSGPITITGNASQSLNGISVAFSSWTTDFNKFKAIIDVDIDLTAIIPNGGRFYVELIHVNSLDGTFTYTSPEIFYDPQSMTQTISNLGISENAITGKWLSGVLYYNLGDTFDITIADMDYLNTETYPDDFVHLYTLEYGINNYNLNGADLTGWTPRHNNVNSSYNGIGIAVNRSNYRYIGPNGNISAQVFDWSAGATSTTPDDTIAIDTYADTSTRTIERFNNESWRVNNITKTSEAFNSADAKTADPWDSTNTISAPHAQYGEGGLLAPTRDYTGYHPGAGRGGDPNYSSISGNTILVREFNHIDGASCANGNLAIVVQSGSIQTLELKMGKARDGTVNGGSDWVDMMSAYNGGTWNFGESGQGCSTGIDISGSTYTYYWTLGNLNLVNVTDGTVYVYMEIAPGTKITYMEMSFV